MDGLAPGDALAAVSLVAAAGVLYGGILRLWWTVDDLFILRLLSIHPALSYGFSPSAWDLAPKMFTPLQFLSYGIDLALFGRRPLGFHAHHLVALAAAALAVYASLRAWLDRRLAWAGSMLLLLGIPTAAWAVELPCRHYIEGLIWAGLSVAFFARAASGKATTSAALAVLFYFLAILEKEIYIPLPILFLVLLEGSPRDRLRRLRPYVLALLVYLAWRWAMLGTLLGGYGWTVRARELPGLLARLPIRVAGTLLSANGAADVALGASLLLGIGALIARRPRSFLWLAGACVLALLPIVPVAKAVGERFGELLWIVLVLAFLLGCREVAARTPSGLRASTGLLLLGLASALWVHALDWRGRFGASEQMSAEGRFFLTMNPGDLLRHPRIPPAAMKETRWYKEESLGRPRGAGWFADDVYLCGTRPNGRIWEYDETAKRVRDITREAWAAAARYCTSLRSTPLEARFESSRGNFFWTLGPYQRGQYALVFDRGIEAVPVDRDGGYQTSPQVLSLMVRYRSPEGWTTYSPQLTMDFRRASSYRWERRGPVP